MRVDLHLHTWVSDGDVSPARVIELARAARLDVIAVTDHDTAVGVPEALASAVDLPITVIPGIEISTRLGEQELHILGYWVDPYSEPILEHQRRAAARRSTRMVAMVERLQGMGIEITYDDVKRAAGPSVKALGRPHLARALHARKHTRFYSEAFVRFIGDSGPAFVAEGFPCPSYAIDTIHAAGGVAVWAHPGVSTFDETLAELVAFGIDGVECFRPGVDAVDALRFEFTALGYGLFPTGGSDWHGPNRFTLGDFALEGSRIREVLAFGGVEV